MKLVVSELSKVLIEALITLEATTEVAIREALENGTILEVDGDCLSPKLIQKLELLEAIVVETPKVEETPKQETPKEEKKTEETPKKEETPKAKTLGEQHLEKGLRIGESFLVGGVSYLEFKGTEAMHKLVCAFGEASKVSKLTKFGIKTAVWGYALSFVCDGIERLLNINLDDVQSFLDKMAEIGLAIAIIDTGFRAFRGWEKGTPEKSRDIINSWEKSPEEIQKMKDDSMVMSFAGI